jgi:hypothetical protein
MLVYPVSCYWVKIETILLFLYKGEYRFSLESKMDKKLNSFKGRYLYQTDKNTQIYRGIEESNNLIVGFAERGIVAYI